MGQAVEIVALADRHRRTRLRAAGKRGSREQTGHWAASASHRKIHGELLIPIKDIHG